MNKLVGAVVVGVVVAGLLSAMDREPAYAQGAASAASGSDVVLMGTGGSQQNFTDIVWVLSRQPSPRKPGADPNGVVASKDERLKLCCYQVGMNGRDIRLVGVRDVTFDADMVEYKNEKPSVNDVVKWIQSSQEDKDGK